MSYVSLEPHCIKIYRFGANKKKQETPEDARTNLRDTLQALCDHEAVRGVVWTNSEKTHAYVDPSCCQGFHAGKNPYRTIALPLLQAIWTRLHREPSFYPQFHLHFMCDDGAPYAIRSGSRPRMHIAAPLPVHPAKVRDIPKRCSQCGLLPPEALLRCTRCHAAWYCNKTCQRAHWPTHRSTCRRAVE